MATYKIQDTTLLNIANAIRAKMGSTSSLTPEEMASAIALISGEGGGTEISFLLEDNVTKIKLEDIPKAGIIINNEVVLQVLLNDIAIWGAKAEFTNLLCFALTRDETGIYGGDYNGDGKNDGYKTSTRLSSSSTNNEASIANAAMCASGFIPVKVGQTVRLTGWTPLSGTAAYFMTFNKDKTMLWHQAFQQTGDWANNNNSTWYDYKNKIMTIPITEDMGIDTVFFRFSGCMTNDTIATVDEEIEL